MASILVACIALAAGTACKAKSEASNAPDPAALKAQQDLIARRDSLLAQRQKLEGEHQKLGEEIKQVEATGGDTTELARKMADVERLMQGQDAELGTIHKNIQTALAKIAAAGDAAAGIASREATMSVRERTVAQREAAIADRERTMAGREAQLAQRERETCGAAPLIIKQASGTYTRQDIEPVLARAKSSMSRKGLIRSDLGASAAFETDATKEMAAGNWAKAYVAAAQLAAEVERIKIDRDFIIGKHGRLNQRVKTAKLAPAMSKQLTDGMTEVVQTYGDGNFAAANKKLNQLYALAGLR